MALLRVKSLVILLIATAIIMVGVLTGPGQVIDPTNLGAAKVSSFSGPSVALAHKKCPANRHAHSVGGGVRVHYWWYSRSQAGPHQFKYKWKKTTNQPFSKVWKIGSKTC